LPQIQKKNMFLPFFTDTLSVILQVVDGIAQASNIVKIRVGTETWEWTNYYDPVVALNPTFYQCAKIKAKLPGTS
jgi:hypothetical protein